MKGKEIEPIPVYLVFSRRNEEIPEDCHLKITLCNRKPCMEDIKSLSTRCSNKMTAEMTTV